MKPLILATLLVIGWSAPALAVASSGQLVLINKVASPDDNALVGYTPSPISVTVSDSTGVCYTLASLAYLGAITVSWSTTLSHSATHCIGITSVSVTPLKTSLAGIVQYNTTATPTLSATAAGATTFTAPTTATVTLLLEVTGGTTSAQTGSATLWGYAAGVGPTYSTTTGQLLETGIVGSTSDS